jgi:hypothetical protein
MRLVLCCLVVVGSACGPPSDSRTLLMLDTDARAAGWSISVGGWKGAPITPIDATERDRVLLSAPGRTRPVEARPGFLAHAVGAAASIDWRELDSEVDSDAFELTGTEAAVHDVATMLGAEVRSSGERRFVLRAKDALKHVAWLEAPSGVEAVAPVLTFAPTQLSAAPFATLRAPTVYLANDAPALVGIYRSEGDILSLDASGGFSLDAPGCRHVEGTYQLEGTQVILKPREGARRALFIGASGTLSDGEARFEEAQ